MKATHKGTCQICNAMHRVNAHGRIANHGYYVHSGGHKMTCPGGMARPYEEGTGALEIEAEYLGDRILTLRAELHDSHTPNRDERIIKSLSRQLRDHADRIVAWEERDLTPI